MTVELTMLALSVALLFVLIMIQANAGVIQNGMKMQVNNRDDAPVASGFAARMKRVVDNHREGLTMFAPLVLIAAVAGISTPTTVLGAQLFFYSRVAHAIIYVLGLPAIRPLAWAIGIAGTVMIFLALFKIA
jgi:uncharacterized MAPEG superfamily protein